MVFNLQQPLRPTNWQGLLSSRIWITLTFVSADSHTDGFHFKVDDKWSSPIENIRNPLRSTLSGSFSPRDGRTNAFIVSNPPLVSWLCFLSETNGSMMSCLGIWVQIPFKIIPVSSTELSNMYELGRPMVSQLFQCYQHKRILNSSFASSAGLLFALTSKQSSPG